MLLKKGGDGFMKDAKYLYTILLVTGFIFLRSGCGKIMGGKFTGTLEATLTKFASENPSPTVKDLLTNTAIPSFQILGFLTTWGEFLVGISVIAAAFYLIVVSKNNRNIDLLLTLGLLGGFMLNFVFYFSAGWTSASTESLNLLMMIIQAIGLVFVLKKYYQKTR